jgi:hypothetical protein
MASALLVTALLAGRELDASGGWRTVANRVVRSC